MYGWKFNLKVAGRWLPFFSATLTTPPARSTKRTSQDDIPGGQGKFRKQAGKMWACTMWVRMKSSSFFPAGTNLWYCVNKASINRSIDSIYNRENARKLSRDTVEWMSLVFSLKSNIHKFRGIAVNFSFFSLSRSCSLKWRLYLELVKNFIYDSSLIRCTDIQACIYFIFSICVQNISVELWPIKGTQLASSLLILWVKHVGTPELFLFCNNKWNWSA